MGISGRGGKREKAGRKSTWPSGCTFKDTKLIRVPTYLVDRLMEIARRLDSGEDIEIVTKSKSANEEKNYKNLTTELVTKSKGEYIQTTLDLSTEPKIASNEELPVIPGKLLALRLGISSSKLSIQKKKLSNPKSLFYDWTQSVDPDGIRWIPENAKKGYRPSKKTLIELVTKLNKWIKDNNN